MPPPSVACITWIKVGSSSFKPILNVGVLLDKFANSAQVDCNNPYIASLIFFALDFVIGPSGTCNGSLRFGLPWGPSEREWNKEREKENNRKLFVVRIVNVQFCLFTIHIRIKNIYSANFIGDKKLLIIVKFNYFEAFD